MSSYKSVSEQDSITPANQSPLEIHKGMGEWGDLEIWGWSLHARPTVCAALIAQDKYLSITSPLAQSCSALICAALGRLKVLNCLSSASGLTFYVG